ncbi:aspartate aminotransferase family protein [Tenacibaculum finnmarkense]|uniref:aspartate aminotransferase family protein n=1 Tax=Tenacibaculum finnmarkense TaxID=2781243 RepID=UPI00187B48AC|nr:aspartate aminotransferase family protein [Tenacibaculum finnmarkense]MBE7660584.1 aminotransferase class III-fold pyridoxal phosphate-dependent enzyme [Tenacibaculum finnmarkense genomovar finnmarkense]MCG8252336.1 aspartate aminotransferase family protein [Tenacibaculum finnmarkense genomovar finnmarkense]MCG8815861.1 aspartate aminotransferase family protein [Tenacibaculum finnmarkense]MCG8820828.1 aspartate aminotransferase family protein [Tenacibaculum finnmarkense]
MKTDFLKYQGQTTPHPLAIEISHAKGSYIYDKKGKKILDFVAGVSANSLGHNHPKVTQAIKKQLDSYTHVMVYGEFIQQPQLDLCKALAKTLPENLSSVYLVNSGTEATEGALKLVKRFTGRAEIIAAKNGYHGNTQGAMSVCGAEAQNRAFRPLIPGVKFIEFNNEIDLEKITTKTAGVILETIQGGAGFIEPKNDYLSKVKKRCEEVGALLILDEIQTGVGRTGKFWGFENYNVIPDIIITGKGLGGGMPIGAFIASFDVMNCLKENPKLGHITTFGGHPVIASAALATVDEITSSNLIKESLRKEAIIRDKFKNHKAVKEIRGRGLMLALIVESPEVASKIILNSLDKGLILFWLLFEGSAIRITPPLTISDDEIKEGCDLILNELNNL